MVVLVGKEPPRPRRRALSEKAAKPPQTQIRVALYDDIGGSSAKRGVANCRGAADLELCLRNTAPGKRIGEFKTQRVTAREIANGILQEGRFDVLIQPGGEGYAQGRALGHAGMQAIREFIAAGNGYIGICAGANLASADENYMPYSLGIVASRTLDTQPEYPQVKNLRGVGTADIEFTSLGKQVFGTEVTGVSNVAYANGPLILRAHDNNMTDHLRSGFEVLATYASEVGNTQYARQAGAMGEAFDMVGKPAAIAAPYGLGRVLCMSPHPEKPQGPHWMVRAAVRWAVHSRKPEVPFRPTVVADRVEEERKPCLKAYKGPQVSPQAAAAAAAATAAAPPPRREVRVAAAEVAVPPPSPPTPPTPADQFCDEDASLGGSDEELPLARRMSSGSVQKLRDMMTLADRFAGPMYDFAAITREVEEAIEEVGLQEEIAELQRRKAEAAAVKKARAAEAMAVAAPRRRVTTMSAAVPRRGAQASPPSPKRAVAGSTGVEKKPRKRTNSHGCGRRGVAGDSGAVVAAAAAAVAAGRPEVRRPSPSPVSVPSRCSSFAISSVGITPQQSPRMSPRMSPRKSVRRIPSMDYGFSLGGGDPAQIIVPRRLRD